MREKETPNYFAVIPANVRYSTKLKPNEKLLYGEITALSNKNGYCFASNRYFAELYFVSKSTVSSWISNLQKQGFVEVTIMKNELNEVTQRRIGIQKKMDTPMQEIPNTPMQEIPKYNNTSINNTSSNNKDSPHYLNPEVKQDVAKRDDIFQELTKSFTKLTQKSLSLNQKRTAERAFYQLEEKEQELALENIGKYYDGKDSQFKAATLFSYIDKRYFITEAEKVAKTAPNTFSEVKFR